MWVFILVEVMQINLILVLLQSRLINYHDRATNSQVQKPVSKGHFFCQYVEAERASSELK